MPAPYMRRLPDLPAERRTDLRYHCGFGCIRCGVTVYRYLALPKLGDMRRDGSVPAGEPTLLCPPCHQLVENERLTPAQVHSFHASPIARQRGFSRDNLPFSSELPELIVGGSRAVRDMPVPISLSEEPLLMFVPPRQGVGATRISVRLGNAQGEPVRVVDANEWLPDDDGWTFAQHGDRYVITAKAGNGLAILRFARRNQIVIEHLRTTIRGRRVEATPDWLELNGQRIMDRIPSGSLIGLEL